MRDELNADRVTTFTDGVFAVIVTVMALELKAPDQSVFSSLWPLWPTAISYAVGFLFIAIIWINDHHLMRFVGHMTLGLVWINFGHLFSFHSCHFRLRGLRTPNSHHHLLWCSMRECFRLRARRGRLDRLPPDSTGGRDTGD